jgi:hypothetical protein
MLSRWFRAHPESVGETYWEHQRVALGFSGALLKAALACFIHGLMPALFQTTASRTVLGLHQSMAARQNHAAESATRTELKPIASR